MMIEHINVEKEVFFKVDGIAHRGFIVSVKGKEEDSNDDKDTIVGISVLRDNHINIVIFKHIDFIWNGGNL